MTDPGPLPESYPHSGSTSPSSATGRVLFLANVDVHLWAFHMPYMRLLRTMGYAVEAAAAPSGYADLIRGDGFQVYPIPFARNPFSARNFAAYRALRRLLHDNAYTMVHVHTPVAAFLGRLAARRAGVRHVIYTAHGFHFHRGGRWWSNALYFALERIAVPWTDVLITINREDYAVASHAFARGGTRVLYVPGVGTDCTRYVPASPEQRIQLRRSLRLPGDVTVVTWVAEFIARKRPFDAVTAASGLGAAAPAYLAMLGDGPMLDSVRRTVSEAGTRTMIACLGRVSNVAEYLGASDIFLSTASQEGLPRNIMEAMAAGLPVVAYDIRGCNDLVIDGVTGFLVPVGDTPVLVRKLAWLTTHQQERQQMGQAGRKRIEGTFALDKVVPQMQTIYQDELRRKT